jgi:hypothetical protein
MHLPSRGPSALILATSFLLAAAPSIVCGQNPSDAKAFAESLRTPDGQTPDGIIALQSPSVTDLAGQNHRLEAGPGQNLTSIGQMYSTRTVKPAMLAINGGTILSIDDQVSVLAPCDTVGIEAEGIGSRITAENIQLRKRNLTGSDNSRSGVWTRVKERMAADLILLSAHALDAHNLSDESDSEPKQINDAACDCDGRVSPPGLLAFLI